MTNPKNAYERLADSIWNAVFPEESAELSAAWDTTDEEDLKAQLALIDRMDRAIHERAPLRFLRAVSAYTQLMKSIGKRNLQILRGKPLEDLVTRDIDTRLRAIYQAQAEEYATPFDHFL